MKKSFWIPLLALILFPILAGAQGTKPVIRFMPFISENIGYEEVRLIETLIQSYLSDFGEVVTFFALSPENIIPSSSQDFDLLTKVPDYIFSGSIRSDRETRIFSLELLTTGTGETVSYVSVHKNTSDLILKARSLVETAFNSGYVPAMGEEKPEPAEVLTENGIAGLWRGDPGIELIRLQRNGRGVAIFSSGARMDLAYSIEQNTLKLKQTSHNNERFYHPLPFEVAKALSTAAEPMAWELFLYEKGTTLRGIKRTTEVRYEGTAVLEFLPNTVREVVWTKSAH
ncbi:MAG: hypothetical protein LBP42_07310 [Treponema sp.]|jgi:hypothetical protein|nr:hypothetical protein [Treponema sp.]